MLGTLSAGCPTYLNKCRAQRFTVLQVGADGCSLLIFLSPIISSFSLSLGVEAARYRLNTVSESR